ncbi:uncharacterized protein LOC131224667 isoform X2 [Magnolia sinica]|uniref:uncharacterized protein LOC131224667 isoform X2 n=1 Tax=Magnolia sinica TaxID=86752 RepID=UPI002659C052|nr:uncharacterized protein LOC131224667 isoform X2 [Magnolia sinica]
MQLLALPVLSPGEGGGRRASRLADLLAYVGVWPYNSQRYIRASRFAHVWYDLLHLTHGFQNKLHLFKHWEMRSQIAIGKQNCLQIMTEIFWWALVDE